MRQWALLAYLRTAKGRLILEPKDLCGVMAGLRGCSMLVRRLPAAAPLSELAKVRIWMPGRLP